MQAGLYVYLGKYCASEDGALSRLPVSIEIGM